MIGSGHIVLGTGGQPADYVFGEVRVATLALLTLTTLSGWRSSGVVMAKFSGHTATFRSSPTVCAILRDFCLRQGRCGVRQCFSCERHLWLVRRGGAGSLDFDQGH